MAFCDPARAADALPIFADQSERAVAPSISWSPVSDVDADAAVIRSLEERLRPLKADIVQFGPPTGPVAARLDVENAGTREGRWIVFTGRGSFRKIKIWRLDGTPQLLLDGSDKASLQRSLRTYQAFSAELSLAPGERAQLAVVFEADDSTYLPLEILTFSDFFVERRKNIAMVAAVVAGALGLILLNIIFFSMTGQREFIWLGLAELAFAFNTLHTEGYTTIFAFAGEPGLSMAFGNVVKCAFAVFMSQFARTFLRTPEEFPRTDVFFKVLIAAGTAIIALQAVAFLGLRLPAPALFYGGWLVAIISALGLPFVAVAATRRLGRQYWPLIVAWGSLAAFVVYAAVATSGIVPGLSPMWHLAGPIGLFEAVMATLALGLHIRTLSRDRATLNAKLTQSLREQVDASERSARLERDRSAALASLADHNTLLHASGHDIQQVVFALRSAAEHVDRHPAISDPAEPISSLLTSSATFLEDVAATAMSVRGGGISETGPIALSAFAIDALFKPLTRIYEPLARNAGQTLVMDLPTGGHVITDRARLIRILSNLLSNAIKFADGPGTVTVSARCVSGMLVATVTDTGRGLSDDLAERLNRGEGRHRADEAQAGHGSGFVQSIEAAQRLGGTLRLTPGPERGAQAELSIPHAVMSLTSATPAELEASTAVDHAPIVDADSHAPINPDTNTGAETHARFAVAATYDDTARGRRHAGKLAAFILIKPIFLEMVDHPGFVAAVAAAEARRTPA